MVPKSVTLNDLERRKMIDKAITIDNLRLTMSSSKRLQRDRDAHGINIILQLQGGDSVADSGLDAQYLPSYRLIR